LGDTSIASVCAQANGAASQGPKAVGLLGTLILNSSCLLLLLCYLGIRIRETPAERAMDEVKEEDGGSVAMTSMTVRPFSHREAGLACTKSRSPF
jgi:hypothetical protein